MCIRDRPEGGSALVHGKAAAGLYHVGDRLAAGVAVLEHVVAAPHDKQKRQETGDELGELRAEREGPPEPQKAHECAREIVGKAGAEHPVGRYLVEARHLAHGGKAYEGVQRKRHEQEGPAQLLHPARHERQRGDGEEGHGGEANQRICMIYCYFFCTLKLS